MLVGGGGLVGLGEEAGGLERALFYFGKVGGGKKRYYRKPRTIDRPDCKK